MKIKITKIRKNSKDKWMYLININIMKIRIYKNLVIYFIINFIIKLKNQIINNYFQIFLKVRSNEMKEIDEWIFLDKIFRTTGGNW